MDKQWKVYSAYGVALHVLKEKKGTKASGNCSDASKMTNLWKSIWKLECPSKIKHFLWRACKDILPTNHFLARRKVIVEDRCAACGGKESSTHALWNCSMAFEVWKEFEINFPRWNNTQCDFIKVYWKLRGEVSNIDWNVFAILVWSIWNNRNLLKHERTCKAAKTIVRDAKRYVEEFRQGTTVSFAEAI